MSREHNGKDKKTALNFQIHCCRNYAAYPKIFMFCIFCIGIEKHQNRWGVRKSGIVWSVSSKVQQNHLKQLFGTFLACIKHTSGKLSDNVTGSQWSTFKNIGQINLHKKSVCHDYQAESFSFKSVQMF